MTCSEDTDNSPALQLSYRQINFAVKQFSPSFLYAYSLSFATLSYIRRIFYAFYRAWWKCDSDIVQCADTTKLLRLYLFAQFDHTKYYAHAPHFCSFWHFILYISSLQTPLCCYQRTSYTAYISRVLNTPVQLRWSASVVYLLHIACVELLEEKRERDNIYPIWVSIMR